jgi:hypothetical protein
MILKHMNSRLFILLTSISLLVGACTERIEVDLDDSYTRLVVDGQLTSDDTATQKITLNESTSYFYNQPPPAVKNAMVQITDNEGNLFLASEGTPGVYELPAGFKAEIGKTYSLDIQLETPIDDQDHYTASSFTPNINDTAYIELEYQPDWGDKGYYVVKCYYWDLPEANFYMFNIYKNDTLLTDTITLKQVVDDRFYNGGFTNGIGVGYLNQAAKREVLRPGDVVTFQACSVTEGYANFVWQVQEEVSFSTPMFSGPPANVYGNLSDGAIGYFTAYPVIYAKKTFEP